MASALTNAVTDVWLPAASQQRSKGQGDYHCMSLPSWLDHRPTLIILIVVLILISLCPLAVSTINLSNLSDHFAVDDRGLLHLLTLTLALVLEITAILSGTMTTSIRRRVGFWPAWMTISALLIWAGNAYVMWLAVPALPWYVPFCAASFAPMFTSGLGIGLGVLFALLGRVTREQMAAESPVIHRLTCGSHSGLDR
ncbi:hypothetical protein [Deinococcus altitudinis]|uniref:hypothetical protein n=1 Tax=Deinococcus altitudinis TaxID=468914 RepID=UPI0038913D48